MLIRKRHSSERNREKILRQTVLGFIVLCRDKEVRRTHSIRLVLVIICGRKRSFNNLRRFYRPRHRTSEQIHIYDCKRYCYL